MSKQYTLVIDLDRCIGCLGGCRVACKLEHGTALGDSRSKMYTMESGRYPELEMYFLPVMCQQCENPPCVNLCPTGACHKDTEDGVIKINTDRCVGCGTCKQSCPYGAMNFNKEMHVMDKCDICSELRSKGEKPACVKNCAGSAIYYGDINDPESEVSKLIREAGENVYSLPDEGNKPSGRFILRGAKWKEEEPWKK
ncbi:MAG TPA: 4Fe-4S dicluster domain-containing protein [Clostridiales bacterium]|nr:4Fe-4S dicluster domain-containing protein [Clostridiales bacterium]